MPPDAFLDIGAFCSLGGATLNNARIGRYGAMAGGVTVGAHEHLTDWLTTSLTACFPEIDGWTPSSPAPPRPESTSASARTRRAARSPLSSPTPGSGQGAFIKAGVTIGPGAIVGARATVLHDVPPHAVVVGTPRPRRPPALPRAHRRALLRLAWWRYSIYDLFGAPVDSIEAVLDTIEDLVARNVVALFPGPVARLADLANPQALARSLTPAVMEGAS